MKRKLADKMIKNPDRYTTAQLCRAYECSIKNRILFH